MAEDPYKVVDELAREMAGVDIDGEDLEAWRANARTAIDFLANREDVVCDRDDVLVTFEHSAKHDATGILLWARIPGYGRWAPDGGQWREVAPQGELPVAAVLPTATPTASQLLELLTARLARVTPLTNDRLRGYERD